ncbi:protein DOG1-like 4 [Sesamum alatum]|uniref:Protein DOG1-like 4 n=1 Tax=Sesamum alatum TaxID=300844 RepID=A0AAE2CZR7_9LAMI|nr:protein DOG1-like 4 [Sesamum alatum]
MNSQVEEKFSDFYRKWMGQLEDLLQLLLMVSREHPELACEDMVNKLTTHHKQYYTFKWAAAHEDVLAFFTPVWLSRLENAHLWVTGWKPSVAFHLVESLRNARFPGASLASMTEEQVRKIEALRVKIKMEEERVEREMERQQVAMADRKMVELARQERLAEKNGGTAVVSSMVEVAVKGMLAGLEKVMKMVDCVRLKTLKGMLDVLTPMQCVDFLAAKSMLQSQMRKIGKKRDKCYYDNKIFRENRTF